MHFDMASINVDLHTDDLQTTECDQPDIVRWASLTRLTAAAPRSHKFRAAEVGTEDYLHSPTFQRKAAVLCHKRETLPGNNNAPPCLKGQSRGQQPQ